MLAGVLEEEALLNRQRMMDIERLCRDHQDAIAAMLDHPANDDAASQG